LRTDYIYQSYPNHWDLVFFVIIIITDIDSSDSCGSIHRNLGLGGIWEEEEHGYRRQDAVWLNHSEFATVPGKTVLIPPVESSKLIKFFAGLVQSITGSLQRAGLSGFGCL
jgi:hypothetical protein